MLLPSLLGPVREAELPAWADRLLAAGFVLTAVLFVTVLLSVDPDARGHGTHEQLSLPPCGWVLQYGRPCPTCGVTTAGCHLVRLQLFSAIQVQPFGAALGLFGLWLAGVALYCLVKGRAFSDYLLLLPGKRLLGLGLVLLLGSWAYISYDFQPK